MRHSAVKYLGWDWRVIPLLGLLGSLVSIILIKELWIKLAIGYAPLIMIGVSVALAQRDIWKDDTSRLLPIEDLVNSRKKNIKDFVFPHMRDFNAYRIVRGTDNIANLRVYFPSLLLDEKELKLKCSLKVNGHVCSPIQIGKVKLLRDGIMEKSFEYPILENKEVTETIKNAVKRYEAIQVSLEIWDEDNEQIRWETPSWSVLPFA